MIKAFRGQPDREAAASSTRSCAGTWACLAIAWAALLAPALANVHPRPLAPARPASAPVARTAVAASAAAAAPSAPATTTNLAQWCARLSPAVPGIDAPACRASGLVAGAGRSVHGVPLWSNDVLPAGGAPKFRVLLLGGIHGDELASVTLAFDWIARSHGVQASAMPHPAKTTRPTIADVAWRFVPLLNPDGLLDFDGPPPAPRRLGSLQLDPVGVYPGSLGNYGGLVKNVPVMTLELKNARAVPPRELAAMWTDLQRWLNEQMTNPGVQASAQRSPMPGTKAIGAPRRMD